MARPSPRSAPCARSWQSSPNSFPYQQRCRVEAQGRSAPAVPGLSSSSPRTPQPSQTRDQAMRLSTSALCKLFGANYTKRTSRVPVSASTGHHWHLPGSAGLSFVLSCHRTEPILIKASKQLCRPVPLCSKQGSLGDAYPPQPCPSSACAAAGLVLSPMGSSHLPPCPQAAPPGRVAARLPPNLHLLTTHRAALRNSSWCHFAAAHGPRTGPCLAFPALLKEPVFGNGGPDAVLKSGQLAPACLPFHPFSLTHAHLLLRPQPVHAHLLHAQPLIPCKSPAPRSSPAPCTSPLRTPLLCAHLLLAHLLCSHLLHTRLLLRACVLSANL